MPIKKRKRRNAINSKLEVTGYNQLQTVKIIT